MKKALLFLLFLLVAFAKAQNNFTVKVNGIKENDSIRIIIQKSSEELFKKWVKYDPSGTATATFGLGEGKWALKIDATGYTYPSNTLFTIPDDVLATVTLTPLLNTDYTYTWQDDESAAGHATERYINEPAKIVVINDTVKVPSDFSAIKLRTEFGIILSDEIEPWSSEDSYRLYKMFSNLPGYQYRGEGQIVDPETGENIRGVFKLTKSELPNDLTITKLNGLNYGTVSQSAFTYAEPQIVTIDGIKGKFFSKRLYHVVVNFITDFANDENTLNWLARERFGIEFMKPDQRTEDIMGEDSSNFQEFFKSEKLEILAMFEELPQGLQKQDGLKYLIRRINGQEDPSMPGAAAIAFGGRSTIEFMSKAFGEINDTRRIILHEKAHFLWFYAIDQSVKDAFAEVGGWFLDPTNPSGWSTYNTTESVSAYAHLKSPSEDFAECVAFYLTNPDALLSVSVRKYEFIRDRIMHGTRYVAQIREDLTFMVYNLFPDYTYPGKVTKVQIMVKGTAEEDKEVTIRATLNSVNPEKDGASFGYIRFASSIGTIHDLWLGPENGQQQDSVLVGKTTFSKLEKSGYWGLSFFRVGDPVGNMRYENTSTLGMKLYIENPLEDILPPQYKYDYAYELVDGKFSDGGFQTLPDENGKEMTALKVSFSHYDASPTGRGYARLNVPNTTMSEVYNRDIQGRAIVDAVRGYDNGFNSVKHFELYLPIYDYYQSGWYSTTFSFVSDIAGNQGTVYHVKDTADFHIKKEDRFKIFKEVRDSIYIAPKYPDYLKPEIDINNITINAQPTNPSAPDGETRVDISILARDLSDFIGKESGVYSVAFTLQDPLGGIHGFQTGNSTMNNPDLNVHDATPQNDNEWRVYNFNLTLPKGSPPGKWGMASAEVYDRAGNRKQYSFVEYVRFDIIESDVVLEEKLVATITDKVVNLANADAITANISCTPCQDKNYVYTIYSLMGGNVVRGSGVFGSDAISLSNINTLGVKDGVIKMTVQVTDDQDRLIATTTTEYTKDTVLPKAYYLQTNLENYGTSNLDALVVKVVVESEDVNGSYKLAFAQNSTTAKLLGAKGSTAVPSDVVMEGLLDQTEIQLSNIDLSTLKDGIISSTLIVTDPNGNVGEPIVTYYNKLDGKLSLIKTITAVNDVIEVNEGGVASVLKNGSTTLLGNDYDSNSVLNAKIVSNPTHGTLILNHDGTFSYTHDGSETTTDSFAYVANDGITDSNAATVSISIIAVNDAPITSNITQTVTEQVQASITLTGTDADSDALTYTIVSAPTNGTATITGNTLSYTSTSDTATSDSISYRANDGTADSNVSTITITITPVNDLPVVANQSATLDEDTTKQITLSGTDADGDSLTFVLGTASHGTLSLSGNVVSYTPTANYNGADSFTYKAYDGTAYSNEATVSLSITSINDAPITSNISQTVTEQVQASITLTGTDADNDALTYTIVSAPTNGTATITGNTLSYTSTSDTATADSISYKANDGTADSNVSTITITITPVNNIPVVANQSATLDEDTTKQITLSGTDADGDSLTFVLGTAAHGTVSLSGNVVSYTPTANYNGADSFTYKANDGTAYSNEATVSLSITSINDAPITSNISQTVTEQVQASITLTGTDADNDALTYTIVSAPTSGTATITGNTLSYTSTSDTATADSISYKANDGTADSNVSTITITITPVNDAPIAVADAITLVQGTSATTLIGGSLSVLANDTDKENNPLTAIIVTGPKNGTLSLNPNGTFSYQHNGSAGTTDSFTYKANDGSDDSNVVTVNINVSPLTLTYNNFAIETKSESCSGMKNGEVIINATQSYNYVAHINGKDYNFVNNNVNISSLPPGTYPLCITIAGIAFEQCFNVTIAAGGSITGKSSIADHKLNVEITEGTAPFTVFVNGQSQFETSESNFSVAVKQGDLLEVQSAKSCEGVYSKTVVELPEAVYAYPNPTKGIFRIVVPTAKEQIYVEVYTMDAKLISKAYYPVENQSVQLNIENNANGVYMAKVGHEKPVNVIVIKN